jgi:hypothetical protein
MHPLCSPRGWAFCNGRSHCNVEPHRVALDARSVDLSEENDHENHLRRWRLALAWPGQCKRRGHQALNYRFMPSSVSAES